jgi:hypothetical protein
MRRIPRSFFNTSAISHIASGNPVRLQRGKKISEERTLPKGYAGWD